MHSVCSGRHVCTLHGPQRSDTTIAFAIKIFRIIQSLRFIVRFFSPFWLDMHMVRLWLPHRFHCIEASTYSIFSIMWLFQYVLPEQAVKATSHSSRPWQIVPRAHHWQAEKQRHPINNVPINEIELSTEWDRLVKKRNSQQQAARLMFDFIFSPRRRCCILKFAIFYDAGWRYTLLDSTILCILHIVNQNRLRFLSLSLFLCTMQRCQYFTSDFSFYTIRSAFWVIGCARIHSSTRLCVARARVYACVLPFDASNLIQKQLNSTFLHRHSSHLRTVDDFFDFAFGWRCNGHEFTIWKYETQIERIVVEQRHTHAHPTDSIAQELNVEIQCRTGIGCELETEPFLLFELTSCESCESLQRYMFYSLEQTSI